MVAESGDVDSILFSSLVDRQIIINLVGFSIDEDFDLFSGKGSEGGKDILNYFKFGQHVLVAIFLIEIIIKNIEFVYDSKYHRLFSNRLFSIFLPNESLRRNL